MLLYLLLLMALLHIVYFFCAFALACPQQKVALQAQALTQIVAQYHQEEQSLSQALQVANAQALLDSISVPQGLHVFQTYTSPHYLGFPETGFTHLSPSLRSCNQWCIQAEGP
ncbi:hypothetical protein POKO110462_02615 [Pontibacter korlensis]|uniref:Uncharacterized protein n=1 Tax=Pontibacter korlensis TaxID=400092 RepID=A0A0E3ZEF5_9BACT|nr:hypothetical protein [Pontibacter korlensis]AKD03645.1 hypothetical protein PKOR_11540 [Pontibacter korlensis]